MSCPGNGAIWCLTVIVPLHGRMEHEFARPNLKGCTAELKGVERMTIAFLKLARKLLPVGLYNGLISVAYLAKVVISLGGTVRQTCPICGFIGRFSAFGLPPRFNARCPKCRSLERHRLFVLCDVKHELLNTQQSVLHFAPEEAISTFISGRVRDCTTADIESGQADLQLDLENVDLPGAAFDVVIANHVLEHVDDAKALKEIFRILRPGGRFISMVPIVEGWERTYENPSIRTPAEREHHFGWRDHVRYYGRDYRDRILRTGFQLEEFGASGAECAKYGLVRGDKVFVGTKPGAVASLGD